MNIYKLYKCMPALSCPDKPGLYQTNLGIREFGKIPFQGHDNEMYWLSKDFEEGHVTMWYKEINEPPEWASKLACFEQGYASGRFDSEREIQHYSNPDSDYIRNYMLNKIKKEIETELKKQLEEQSHKLAHRYNILALHTDEIVDIFMGLIKKYFK